MLYNAITNEKQMFDWRTFIMTGISVVLVIFELMLAAAVVWGLLGSPAFTQKAVFKAQTERKVSQWENKLKENTETQVWGVCLFSSASHDPRNGAGG